MKVGFADSFGDSLKRMMRHQTWWYKTYELFRYDLPRFFKNVWMFRKALWKHYWFDHHGTLMFLETGLTHISDTVEKYGNEVDESRLKKVAAMRRAIELIKNYNEDKYIEMAEKELGEIKLHDWEFEETGDTMDNPMGEKNEKLYRLVDKDTPEEKEHNRKVFDRAHEIESQEWDELFKILKGQDYTKFDKEIDWYKQFDGSGIKGWWD
jgi:hypothetical protein